jgi:TonB family protein
MGVALRSMKSGAIAVAIAIASLLVSATAPEVARASFFCAADVGIITPWSLAANGPSASASSATYLYQLEGDAPATLSGHVIMVTDTKAYAVPFDGVELLPSQADPRRFVGSSAIVTLPEPAALRYAWVDDVVVSHGGKDVSCPTQPYKLQAVPHIGDDQTPVAAPSPLPSIRAAYMEDLPAATCAKPYIDAAPIGKIGGDKPYVNNKLVKGASTGLRIDIDSDGKPQYIAVTKSSGSMTVDFAAREAAAKARYQPAVFRCTPVVASIYYTLDYNRP